MENQDSIPRVNGLNFEAEVLKSEGSVVVDCSAAWCAPCKLARPVLEELLREHAGALKIVEVDGEESPDLVAQLGVRGFPTFIAFGGGREVARATGFGGAAKLRRFAQESLQGMAG